MSINSKMTAIADKIRTLLGISSTMGLDSMAGNLQTAVTTVDTQASLIAQIEAALEGKAAGSGGVIPMGIRKLATGTYKATSNASTTVSIEHNLGEAPNIFIIYPELGEIETSDYTSVLISNVTVYRPVTGSTTYGGNYFGYLNTSGVTQFSSTTLTSVPNTTTITVPFASTRKQIAGATYRWFAMVMDSMG